MAEHANCECRREKMRSDLIATMGLLSCPAAQQTSSLWTVIKKSVFRTTNSFASRHVLLRFETSVISMPSPAPTRRSSKSGGVTKSTPAKSKAVDIGKPLGIYDTNSVREKVRLWQHQGGGVITANDVLADEDDENIPKSKIEQETPKATPHKTVARLKEEDDDSNTDSRRRGNIAPRKRVISDEHWKIKRSAPKTPPPKTRPPKRITVYKTNDEFINSPGTKKGGPKSDTSKSRIDDDGIRIYATPPSSRRQSKQTKHAPDEASNAESILEDEASSIDHTLSTRSKKRSSPKTPKDKHHDEPESERSALLPEDDGNEWAPSEANFSELSRRRARGPTNSTRRPPPKIHKGGIFGHMLDESKKMFARPEPPPPAPTRGAKIEAWLSATSDPFMEDDGSDVEVPTPLKTISSTKESSQRMESEADEPSEKSPGSSGSRRRRSTHRSRSRRKDYSYVSDKDNISSRESLSAIAEEAAQTARRKSDTSSLSTVRRTAAHKRSQSASRIGKDSPRHKGEVDEKESHPDTESLPFSDGSEVSASEAPFPLNTRRPFPSTGVHRLSTIPSVETLKTHEETQPQTTELTDESKKEDHKAKSQDDSNLESEERDSFDPNSLPGSSSGLRRRLTTHEDLMSVLSEPGTRNRSTRSTRSIRSNRSRLANATMDDLMQELSSDETKYMRELRTLVGGVIPVLLTCVLSRSDSAIAAGLFRPALDPKDDMNFTKPIVDMGVALERLKSMHKRIPLDNPDTLLTWAHGAQRVYRDYLKAWRLGFQDVVVNLAPPEEGAAEPNSDTKSLDQGMERDESGDIVNADGQKVDVAYLLKRPLVRLKYLSKTFRGINTLKHSPKAEEIATAYQALVTEARRRSNEERARLEDESAASIDPTRARDPGTLAALPNVSIDQTRRVRARDFFDLSLYHSSGQMVDCRSELLLRDNAPEDGAGGDLLICEVDNSDRWLLFPPIDISCVSARSGDGKGEIVVMIRSPPGEKREWQELLCLMIDDEEIGLEWIQLLGEDPVPPAIHRTQSFIARSKDHSSKSQQERSSDCSPKQKLTPNPSEIDIPIGEQATAASRSKRRSISPKELLSEPSTLSYSSAPKSRTSLYSAITRESDYSPVASESSPKAHAPEDVLTAKSPTGLKRSKAKRVSRHAENLPSSPASRMSTTPERDVVSPPSQKHDRYYDAKAATKSPEPASAVHHKHDKDKSSRSPVVDENRERRPRVSSVPSMDLPTIQKVRKGTQSHNTSTILSTDEDDLDDFSDISDAPNTAVKPQKENSEGDDPDDAPAPPPHRSPSTAQLKQQNIPVLSPTAARQRRRSSSPLKHEYEPSTASDTASEYSETSTVMHYDMDSEYSSSETSDDELEDDDMPTPLPPIQPQKSQKRSAPPSIPTLPCESLDPSNSASQGPYRTVPLQPEKSSKAIASVFGWSDKGTWENLFPDECSITVTPGLIEAFEMNAAHSNPEAFAQEHPLIALELTPLVPIRRGTAIDISIRSPPTERSKIKSNNNIMFRSRSTEECEALYAMINHARINNPTYIALQNARGPFAGQPASLERYNSTRSNKSGGWFSWPKRRNSYRASGTPRSLAEASESSVGTMSSAFSALKKFGAGSKMFSIARSTITSRTGGSKGDSLYSSEAGSGAKSPGSGLAGLAGAIKGVDGIGLSNAKIRLYLRESQSKWRDLGAARLTIMPASPAPSRPQTSGGSPENGNINSEASESSRPPSVSAPPRREMTSEKRIIVRGKTRGEILLDVCLGESAFERVARTGIAVSVWEENEGGTVAKEGGVTGGSFKIYMIQMKTEAETAYTFGLVGKLRY
ncbi:hypothetical protein DTO021D3_8100 [Paecilomyces variotii]|nr:hypothetical protein DTO032I3_7662 [Paecilomyces variotii]KAJ9275025.1 hypothetical protein DTO021D3_8100 [Paecilomyces variotii]KAJ9342399.1 hypothetical protein DTO027B6_5122 [Paecilomyces variotii]KAJ9381283.1 hypothetical protein DTO032I4_6277 [Paecilomyces variotii]